MIVCDNNSTSCSCDCFANIDIDAVVDNTTGTPNVTVNREGNKLTFAFSGLKGLAGLDGRDGQSVHGEDGQLGEPGLQGAQGITPDIQVEAHVDNTVGDPSVRVTKSGTIERPMFDFTFSGIKGLNGTNGVDGRDGEDGRDGIDGTNGSNYDDSALLEKINKNTQDIHNILNGLDNTVKDAVDDLFEDSGWVQQHIPQGQTGGSSNFGEDDVEQYLQRLGFWDTYTDPNTGNLVTITKFSKILQDVDDIRLSVGLIESNQQVGGQVDYTTLAANLYTTIQNNASSAGLNSYWGRLVQVDSTAKKQFLEWMLSAVDTYSTAGETFSTLLSAAHDYNTNQRAYAGLKNLIQYDTSTGGYTASQSLTSLIENTVTGKINQAGLLTNANFLSSSATLFAQGTSAYAAVEAIVNGKTSTLTLSADRINLNGKTWAQFIGLSLQNSDFDNTYHIVIEPSTLTVSSSGNKQGRHTVIKDSYIEFESTSTPGTLEGNVGASGFSFPGLEYQGTYGPHGNLICRDNILAAGFMTPPASQGSPIISGATLIVPYTDNGSQKYMIFKGGLFIGTSTDLTSAQIYLHTGSADANITRS